MELNPKAIYDIAVSDPTRAVAIFMAYDLEITVTGNIKIELGRFSLFTLSKLHIIANGSEGTTIKIGAFCQAASQSSILLGGNHSNGSLLNYSFGRDAEFYRHFMAEEDKMAGMEPANHLVIGDNVIISRGAIVLDSAEIGTGSVIGAGALVTGKCEPLGIYAGVPAKLLRHRFDERMAKLYEQVDLPNICAHCLPTIASKIARLEAGDITIEEFRASVEYLKARPKVHLTANLKDNMVDFDTLDGFSISGVPVTDKVDKLLGYFAQPKTNPSQLKWSADIFYALGLY